MQNKIGGQSAVPQGQSNSRQITPNLAAATGAAAGHAFVATAVANHDGAADVAGGGVAEVDDAGKGVGGVDRTSC